MGLRDGARGERHDRLPGARQSPPRTARTNSEPVSSLLPMVPSLKLTTHAIHGTAATVVDDQYARPLVGPKTSWSMHGFVRHG